MYKCSLFLIKSVLLLSLSFSYVSHAAEAPAIAANTPQVFAKKIAEAIIKEDFKRLRQYIITGDGMLWVFQDMIKKAKSNKSNAKYLSELEKRYLGLKQDIETIHTMEWEKITNSFFDLIAAAKKEGFDLKVARFGKLTKLNHKDILGQKTYSLFFTIVANGSEYGVKLGNVLKVPSGYVLGGVMKWEGKKK